MGRSWNSDAASLSFRRISSMETEGHREGKVGNLGGHLIRMQNGLEVKHGKAASPNKPT